MGYTVTVIDADRERYSFHDRIPHKSMLPCGFVPARICFYSQTISAEIHPERADFLCPHPTEGYGMVDLCMVVEIHNKFFGGQNEG